MPVRVLLVLAACLLLAACLTSGSRVHDSASRASHAPATGAVDRSRWATEATTTSTTSAPRANPPRASRSRSGGGPPTAPAPQVSGDIFDALARCESGMRRVTPGLYHSYFQWSLSTWHSLGFSGIPEDYDYATQKAAAQRLVARSGWGQFPVCSRRIGAR